MQSSIRFVRKWLSLLILIACCAVNTQAAFAQSAVKLKGQGAITLSSEGPSPFAFSGTASHLGNYRCHGEMTLQNGGGNGAQTGTGVAVFEAANGDLLVGVVTMQTGASGDGDIHFSWRDSVQFSDGTVVSSTGRFVNSRPPGAISTIHTQLLVVIAIIAILIG